MGIAKKVVDTLALKHLADIFKPSTYKFREQFLNASKSPEGVEKLADDWGKKVYAFSIWAQVITSTLNPILMYFQYKNDEAISPKERKMLISQEVAKQIVQICLHVGVMLIFAKGIEKGLTKSVTKLVNELKTKPGMLEKHPHLLKDGKPNEVLINNIKSLFANIGGCFAAAVFLPILGATLFKYIDKKMGLTDAHAGDPGTDKKALDDKAAEPGKTKLDVQSPAMLPGQEQVHTAAYHSIPMVHSEHPIHLSGASLPSQKPAPSFASANPYTMAKIG